jgi:hypothetical protein
MSEMLVRRRIPADVGSVWRRIADVTTHHEWMSDARAVTLSPEGAPGVGSRLVVDTRIGPFRTSDVMVVTAWAEGESITVAHQGTVGGSGVISVAPDGDGSVVSWREALNFPWWLGGPLAGWVAGAVLRRVWASNLARLEELVSSP